MIKKIVSGGQTGADRAALDLAIKFNIDHGGWIPKGRKTEAGPLPDYYRLTEMPTDDYKERTRQNIIDSHGTVIISRAELTGGSLLTQSYAKVVGRPNCFLNLSYTEEYEAGEILKSFILENRIEILNVAGPRMSSQPWVYQDVKTVLEVTLYMLFLDSEQGKEMDVYVPEVTAEPEYPKSMDEAISLLSSELPLKTRVFMAKLDPEQMYMVYFGFLDYIKKRLGLDSGNRDLIEECFETGILRKANTVEDAVMILLLSLKAHLEPHHALRIVK